MRSVENPALFLSVAVELPQVLQMSVIQQLLWGLESNLFTLPPVNRSQPRCVCCIIERLCSSTALIL